jgi:hypothetical protein
MHTSSQLTQRFFQAVTNLAKLKTESSKALASRLIQLPTIARPQMLLPAVLVASQSTSPCIDAVEFQNLARLAQALIYDVSDFVGVLPVADDDLSEAEEEAENVQAVPCSQIQVYRSKPHRALATPYANVLWLLTWLVDDAICNNGWRMTAKDRATWAEFSLDVLRL